MSKYVSKRKRTIQGIMIAAAVIALIVIVYIVFSIIERNHDKAPEGAGLSLSRSHIQDDSESAVIATLYYKGHKYAYNYDLASLLILGIDDPETVETDSTRNTSQADFILLAVFDPADENCTLIQLNRDTMTDVPELDFFGNYMNLTTEQLALAHTYGNGLEKSSENTVHAVSRLLYGVEIDNYFALTMDGIPILNDLVGGVTVKVEDDFSKVDDTLVKGETVTLDAGNVEHFVRSRSKMDDPTNIARMRRQQDYMYGLFKKLSQAVKKDTAFVLEAYGAVADALVTDCTIDQLNDYAKRFSGYELSDIITPEGEAVVGEKYMEFYVDEDALQQLVVDTFYLLADDE